MAKIAVSLRALVYPAWVTEAIDALDPEDVRRLASFVIYTNVRPNDTGVTISASMGRLANRVDHLPDLRSAIGALLLAERAGAYITAERYGDSIKYEDEAA